MNHNPAIAFPGSADRSLRYCGVTDKTGAFWLGAVVAIGLHASLFLFLNDHPLKRTVSLPKPSILTWALPPLIPEDPPEVKPSELSDETPSVRVPSLLDLPSPVTIKTPFTQLLDPATPIKLDGATTTAVIPVNPGHGPLAGGGQTPTFNPSELERVPEAVSRVSPEYPFELKREGVAGTVRIGFIVDSHGNVVSPYIISSTDRGFERAALEALAKWKFRPGVKFGRKVNTRMEQPIDFNLAP